MTLLVLLEYYLSNLTREAIKEPFRCLWSLFNNSYYLFYHNRIKFTIDPLEAWPNIRVIMFSCYYDNRHIQLYRCKTFLLALFNIYISIWWITLPQLFTITSKIDNFISFGGGFAPHTSIFFPSPYSPTFRFKMGGFALQTLLENNT